MIRLLSYNIGYGGSGREREPLASIAAASPDVVMFQEATRPSVIARLARATGMKTWDASARHSVGSMNRLTVSRRSWHRPCGVRRAYLEVALANHPIRIYGLHLAPVHSNWTEAWRARELHAILVALSRQPQGPHVLTGDFNTLAPDEVFDLGRLPPHLRCWPGSEAERSAGKRFSSCSMPTAWMGIAGHHPGEAGHTFPTWDPPAGLDYLFLPRPALSRLVRCNVVHGPRERPASDHFPLLAEIEIS